MHKKYEDAFRDIDPRVVCEFISGCNKKMTELEDLRWQYDVDARLAAEDVAIKAIRNMMAE